ncbi:MAG: hypothetical protein ABI818_05375 [Acidobacteriota bacterium]
MSSRLLVSLVCLIAAMCVAEEAFALNYKVIPKDADGKRVLLAYNCGYLVDDPDCPAQREAFRNGFAAGELGRLRQQWSKGPFAEVWLLSGGGLLDAGIELANELRDRSQTVRVPNAARLRGAGLTPRRTAGGLVMTICASSCTVAFMGGQFRFIDLEPGDEAMYAVHAASAVAWHDLDAPGLRDAIAIRAALARSDMPGLVAAISAENRATAGRLFTVFQETLWLVVKNRGPNDPERRARDRALTQLEWESRSRPPVYPIEQRTRDMALLDLEGDAALQDILMRVERASMQQALAGLRGVLPSLGRRADGALDMVAAMYDTSSILETNQIPKETLLKMGYLTEFIK